MRAAAILLCALAVASPVAAVELSEYQLKAAFLYNFASFTSWPADVGNTLKLCIHGRDPFGPELDALQDKRVDHRRILIERTPPAGTLGSCQIVFIAGSAANDIPRTLESLKSAPALTVADSPGAARQGVMLNMEVARDKITFAANLKSAQRARLILSSKLLGLATEVVR